MFQFFKSSLLLSLTFFCFYGHALPSGIKQLSNIPYGENALQTMDVYMPDNAKGAPVIFMVHGGAWSGGDKARTAEFENKVNHWVTKGFVFISTNYRTLPEVDPVGQAKDIELALAFAQQKASEWGGSANRFIVMGHSSGAHLVSLFSANLGGLTKTEVKPWLGTISLDISGYNLVKKVTGPKPSAFYKEKFGDNPAYIQKASPFHALKAKLPPFLAVCSKQSHDACSQATAFINKAKKLGSYGKVLAVDLSHNEINKLLGTDGCYTNYVDKFLKKLGDEVAELLVNDGASNATLCSDA